MKIYRPLKTGEKLEYLYVLCVNFNLNLYDKEHNMSYEAPHREAAYHILRNNRDYSSDYSEDSEKFIQHYFTKQNLKDIAKYYNSLMGQIKEIQNKKDLTKKQFDSLYSYHGKGDESTLVYDIFMKLIVGEVEKEIDDNSIEAHLHRLSNNN